MTELDDDIPVLVKYKIVVRDGVPLDRGREALEKVYRLLEEKRNSCDFIEWVSYENEAPEVGTASSANFKKAIIIASLAAKFMGNVLEIEDANAKLILDVISESSGVVELIELKKR
jgi:hypothetical protein